MPICQINDAKTRIIMEFCCSFLLFICLFPLCICHSPISPNAILNRPFSAKDLPNGMKFSASEEFFGRVKNVQMNELEGIRLFQHWIDQAMSSLLAAVANKKLKTLPNPKIHSEFGKCSASAKSIPIHAKCVSNLLKGQFKGGPWKNAPNPKKYSPRFERYKKGGMKNGGQKNSLGNGRILSISEILLKNQKKTEWIGSFRLLPTRKQRQKMMMPIGRRRIQIFPKIFGSRRKRNIEGRIVVQREKYQLHNPSVEGKLSPIGSVAKLLMAELMRTKGKNGQEIVPWQQTIERLKKMAISIKKEEVKKLNGQKLEEAENLEELEDELKFRGIGQNEKRIPKIIEDPNKLEPKKQQMSANRIVQLLRQAILLGYSLSGQNGTKIDDRKTLRTLSPKFLNVIPNEAEENEEDGTVDILSPSLFSLHNQGKQNPLERLTSLPSLFQHFGSNQDQQQWMNFIIEAAGVSEHADRIEMELSNKSKKNGGKNDGKMFMDSGEYEREVRTPDGMPLYFTMENVTKSFGHSNAQKCAQIFEKLTLNFSREQHREMNSSGYAFLSPAQLQMLYGPKSPYSNPKALRQFNSLANSSANLHAVVERDIHALAQMDHFGIRQKDIVLSPIAFTPFIGVFILLNPVILSPIIFSPLILSPSILGPIVLSPWMFVPLVLSPRVMSPLILSPLVFDPIILSPLALHPTILSPGLFNPLVLNPLVLSPIILSPQVFTPLILSPLALSPFILNPNVGSPLILSPYVLSPIIFSPQFLSALVLSPYALSPVIASPLTAFSIILSPSWLS